MSAKRALIVDDSKSARVVLSRMLQKYDVEVDTAASAEEAIDYLVQNRPDVIFMDHLMPGMDGFQAVQAIKNNPRTATIPIMMYTSQEGELYVGQARALGAVGVLPKLVKPVDVSKVLYQLHLLPDRRDMTPPAFIAANAPAQAHMQAANGPMPGRPETGAPPPRDPIDMPADWPMQLEAALRNHDAELRRFVVASLDTYSDRVVSDIRNAFGETPALQAPPPVPERRPPYGWLLALAVAVIPGIVLGFFYARLSDSNRTLKAERIQFESANVDLKAANAELERAVDRLTRLNAEAAAQAPTSPPQEPTSPGAARTELVPYGEIPFAGSRLDALRQMLSELSQQSFQGTVRAQAYQGRFCLTGNASEGWALAPVDMPAARCDLIGNPFADSLSEAQRQSLGFANLAASLRQSAAGAVTVETATPDNRLAVPYPAGTEGVSAGTWNEAAARNNRVEFTPVRAR